jgi:hypothetical protein
MDLGALVGIITLALSVPVGVLTNLLTPRFSLYLEKRKLIRANATRQQAIRMYNRVKAFHNGTRDRYPYYLQLGGWAVICAVASSTCIILIVLIKPELLRPIGPSAFVLLVLAAVFATFSVLLMAGLHGVSRQLDRFDDYKAELERQWGPIDENPDEA